MILREDTIGYIFLLPIDIRTLIPVNHFRFIEKRGCTTFILPSEGICFNYCFYTKHQKSLMIQHCNNEIFF